MPDGAPGHAAMDPGDPGQTAVVRAYLAPAEHWALPLRDAFEHDPQAVLDRGFMAAGPAERVVLCFIVEPVHHRVYQQVWSVIARLRAGEPATTRAFPRRLVRGIQWVIRQLADTSGPDAPQSPPPTRAPSRVFLAQAQAAEAKAQAQLVTMQVLLRVEAPTKAQAKARFARVASTFAQYAGPFNRLEIHRPWRGKTFDRHFREGRPWRGASFVATVNEAAAITGRLSHELQTLGERRVWRRDGPRYGTVAQGQGLVIGTRDRD